MASALAALETLWVAQRDHPAFAWPEGLERPSIDEPRAPWIDASEHKALIDELMHLSADDLDLLVYLIASHHGKVRMSLVVTGRREDHGAGPLPGGHSAGPRGARGRRLWLRAAYPAPTALHFGHRKLAFTSIRCRSDCRIATVRRGASARKGCSERLGPFRLAYLEALLRRPIGAPARRNVR